MQKTLKEFVNKLIRRLERLGWVYADYYPDETAIHRKRKKSVAYDDVISIVNELTEEYINCSTDIVVGTSSGWIPCTIAMPEKEQMYEVTMEIEICSEPQYVTDYALLDSNGKWLKGCRFKNGKVIAWKEKTDPYVPKKE